MEFSHEYKSEGKGGNIFLGDEREKEKRGPCPSEIRASATAISCWIAERRLSQKWRMAPIRHLFPPGGHEMSLTHALRASETCSFLSPSCVSFSFIRVWGRTLLPSIRFYSTPTVRVFFLSFFWSSQKKQNKRNGETWSIHREIVIHIPASDLIAAHFSSLLSFWEPIRVIALADRMIIPFQCLIYALFSLHVCVCVCLVLIALVIGRPQKRKARTGTVSHAVFFVSCFYFSFTTTTDGREVVPVLVMFHIRIVRVGGAVLAGSGSIIL